MDCEENDFNHQGNFSLKGGIDQRVRPESREKDQHVRPDQEPGAQGPGNIRRNLHGDGVTNASMPSGWSLSEEADGSLSRSVGNPVQLDTGNPQSSIQSSQREASQGETGVEAVMLVGEEGTTFPLLEHALSTSLGSNGPNGCYYANRDRDSCSGEQSQVGPLVCYLTIRLGKEDLVVCIDSGATFSLIGESAHTRIQGQNGVGNVKPTMVKLKGAGGQLIPLQGTCNLQFTIPSNDDRNTKYQCKVLVGCTDDNYIGSGQTHKFGYYSKIYIT
ncbi:MAG: hypothetical protein GY702_04505 [Desulfobulbaceae bacterium]|nr:hypothetical protein [Desulfobulbaceae bacterium]